MGKVHGKQEFPQENDPQEIYSVKPFHMSKWNLKSNLDSSFKPTWRIRTPKPRSGHRIVCDDSHMYSYGGYKPRINSEDLTSDDDWEPNRPLFKELWKFNFSTSSWKKIMCTGFPEALVSNAVYLSGKILMIFGGTGVPFGANCSNNLYLCDLSKEDPVITKVQTTGKMPLPQYGQAIVLYENYMYTIGGTTGFEYTSDIHRLNLKNGVWENVYICKGLRSEPPGMYRHEVVLYESKIFVFGGGTINETYGFQGIYVFSIETDQWESIVTIPDPKEEANRGGYPANRYCHSCVQLPDKPHKVIILGGFDGHFLFGDAWMFDLINYQWQKLIHCSIPAMYFHSSAITPSGKLLTFGGVVEKGSDKVRTSDIYGTWMCVPKLKEICWDAIVFYNPKLDEYSPGELLSFGVPYEYVRRIYPSTQIIH